MATASLFDDGTPSSVVAWKQAASKGGLLVRSHITESQFLVLRTLIINSRAHAFNPARYQLTWRLGHARQLLRASTHFAHYVQAIRAGSLDGMGDFGPLRKQQYEILAAGRQSDKLRKCDETPINPSNTSWWRNTKIRLEANFGHLAGVAADSKFVAITDGQMQDKMSMQIKGVVECKSRARRSCGRAVDMQEAAMLVAWIKEFPGPQRRVLVSQDGREIYVTFAVYGEAWKKDYLRDGNLRLDARGFMRINRFGPWVINDADNMEEVAAILLAISL
ncbi:hypothetical protein BDW59DRAFT_172933 [Aspergillus cavernicola]|uniref:Uncharacterized protein n=1 Tax=Aspergillus cavernicola TaxID=176166 RepID=A0ABR4I9J4_9EURO